MDIENIESKHNIVEVKKVKDFNELLPKYDYSSIGVSPDKNNPGEIGVIYFNGPIFNQSEYITKNEGSEVTFDGPLGEFAFYKNFVRSNGKSPFVFGRDLSKNVYDKLLPLMKGGDTNLSGKLFSAVEIKAALKNAFIRYWEPETNDLTEGLRNIHTIGEREGSDVNWSIMNFFDTREIPKLITKKWEKEGSGDRIKWLTNIFENDKIFLNVLLDRQWSSIKSGIKTENDGLINLIEILTKDGYKFDYETYPYGHKKDRFDAIDISIKIEGKKPFGVQVKPLSRYEKLLNGDILVYTNGMNNGYKGKEDLKYIFYNDGDRFIMFRNENYNVENGSEGKKVIHYSKPSKIHK